MTSPSAEHWQPRTLLDAAAMAHVGIWEWDAASGEVRWSDELCRIYGFDPDEFEHDFGRFMATVVAEDRPLIDGAMTAAFSEGKGFEFDLRIVGEDGVARVLHARGTVTVDPATGRTCRLLGTTQDITARKRAEAALVDSEQRFRAAFDNAPIGMALVGTDGGILRVNRAVCEMLARPAEELLSMTFPEITHPDDLAADTDAFESLLDGRAESYSLEKRYVRPDGEVVWGRLAVSPVPGPDGAPLYFVSQVQDLSEERRLREHLHHLADHDPLTGLYNRRRFDEELRAQTSRADRYGETGAVVLLDLDHFKQVNDAHGHHEGDAVLRRVGEVIDRRMRASDAAARLGGDEFGVLLVNVGHGDACRVAGELVTEIEAAAGMGVTASAGVAMLDAAEAPDVALKEADRLMYAHKRTRREPVAGV